MYEWSGVERGVMKDRKSTPFWRITWMYTIAKATVFCRTNPTNKILKQNLSSLNCKPKHQPSNTFHTATMEECHSSL
jgi:hypothetical protein